ncbi:hypothetical protein Pla52o_29700 [Novipirellula galeiformis]|uniref:Major exported protein n=1 Tax=Novipirellula galeiformis TaxID=2528004 RepID=A0A5C6CJ12_9BACT|nr:type VI secretion system tube protein Hcp [Novipirellula galeiformis]TWU23434.1 hypothetical protein Pla52o_29700 [Novipirellula galeiformis]
MIILVRVRDVKGRCRIPGYDKNWFEARSVEYGVQNKRPGNSSSTDASRGLADLQALQITKVVDQSTSDLMFQGMKGEAIASVEIQMVETAKNGAANYPFLMLRFEDTFVVDWKLNLSSTATTETVSFEYEKVAIEYHRTSDGLTYERVGNKGWDASLEGSNNQLGAPWDYTFKQRGDK